MKLSQRNKVPPNFHKTEEIAHNQIHVTDQVEFKGHPDLSALLPCSGRLSSLASLAPKRPAVRVRNARACITLSNCEPRRKDDESSTSSPSPAKLLENIRARFLLSLEYYLTISV
jgi:hypothetical protein